MRPVDLTGGLHGPAFDPLADPDFFAQVRVDDELGTVVWPNGADLDPLVLHGDFEPAPRLVHRGPRDVILAARGDIDVDTIPGDSRE